MIATGCEECDATRLQYCQDDPGGPERLSLGTWQASLRPSAVQSGQWAFAREHPSHLATLLCSPSEI
jgi:hypothetical protein